MHLAAQAIFDLFAEFDVVFEGDERVHGLLALLFGAAVVGFLPFLFVLSEPQRLPA